jgi:hypothetical protein
LAARAKKTFMSWGMGFGAPKAHGSSGAKAFCAAFFKAAS